MLILLPFLLFYYQIHRLSAFCPKSCKCNDDFTNSSTNEHRGASHSSSFDSLNNNFRRIIVDCTEANLNHFPILLNPRTKRLILNRNRLISLTSDETSLYEDLQILDLSENLLTDIKAQAFHR